MIVIAIAIAKLTKAKTPMPMAKMRFESESIGMISTAGMRRTTYERKYDEMLSTVVAITMGRLMPIRSRCFATAAVPLIPAEGIAWSRNSLARLRRNSVINGILKFAAVPMARQISACAAYVNNWIAAAIASHAGAAPCAIFAIAFASPKWNAATVMAATSAMPTSHGIQLRRG